MDLKRLKVFYILVKAGSFTKAAKHLNMNQSSISSSIQIFEHSVKATLLHRTTRKLVLTNEGERMYAFASKIFEDVDNFMEGFPTDKEELEGDLKIITTPSFGEIELTTFLLPFIEMHPNLNIQLLTTIEEFDTQFADVAIRSFIPHRPELEQILLQTYHLKLWASKEYLEKFGTPQSIADLNSHRLLTFATNHKINMFHHANWPYWILEVGNETNKSRQSFFRISSNQGLYNAALEGYGIIQFPKETIKLLNSPLVPILPELEEPLIEYYFIYRKKSFTNKRIISLYEHLSKSFQDIRETFI